MYTQFKVKKTKIHLEEAKEWAKREELTATGSNMTTRSKQQPSRKEETSPL